MKVGHDETTKARFRRHEKGTFLVKNQLGKTEILELLCWECNYNCSFWLDTLVNPNFLRDLLHVSKG